ncbi:CopD family protein [Fictibacillus nanhaiensis]|uniref:copper resistance D family protein n=1 Tax=Fictibacillus nanhaiensis TaxID=742169 RepID=UPI002E219B99|nr:CopD family protein [Fictibacillus nanhaiensis]MED1862194.1 CopD family protein [Fictibacillus nanhaiensis]
MFFVAKAMLYVCFSLLMGAFILYTVPRTSRPEIYITKKLILILIAIIPLFGIGELVRLTMHLGEDFGYWLTFQNIVFSFEVGKGWLFLTGISVLLFFMVLFNDIKEDRFFAGLAVFLIGGMGVSVGYASHAASLESLGFLAHSLHFIAVITWSGVLLVSGYFSRGEGPNLSFYKWFTPLAVVCLATVIGAGLWLMNYIVPEYVNSYLLDYGQALLIKHILLFIIVFYSLINGIWLKKRLNQGMSGLSLKKWMKAEGILLFSAFVATALMTQQTPPHDVADTLKMEDPSKLFTFSTGLIPGDNPMLSFSFSLMSLVWLALAVVLVLSIFATIKRNKSMILAVVASFLAASAIYIAVMSSVSL